MDNDMQVKDSVTSSLPRARPFPASSASTMAKSPGSEVALTAANVPVDGEEPSGVFLNLVTSDNDIAGLVAYSIYKQNKLDWLRAFKNAQSRTPNDDELASYIIGEGTPRRLATYRHLAEATLAGNGPTVHGSSDGLTPMRGRSALAAQSMFTPWLVATYVLIAVLCALGLWLAFHYTMTTR